MDLEYADRVGADFGGGESMQVWLAARADAGVLDRLRDQGVQVLDDESLRGVADRYTGLGPPLALKFALAAALVGVLLAAGTVSVVAAVERRSRGPELAALRVQGASAGLTRRVGASGYAVLVVVSLVLGALLAAAVRGYFGDIVPFFADGWSPP
jgi:hypothetical protein